MVENGETNETKGNNVENGVDQVIENLDCLPSNCFPLTHQVAGHFFGKGRTKLGLLQTNDGLVLKPVQSPPRGEREHNFFIKLFQSDESELNEDQIELKKLIPNYRGSFIHNDIVYIKMDDIAHGFKYPAIIDLKIGKITYDPEASIEKINRQKLKYPPVESLGFQLLGMRVFDREKKTFSSFDKKFGRSLSEHDLIHGIALYYQFHQSPQIKAIKETIRKFQEIEEWFKKQKTYHFYSSSLIVAYEANSSDNTLTNEYSESIEQSGINNNNGVNSNYNSGNVRVVLADFAHVFPAKNMLDENYIFGLNKVIAHLNYLLSPDYKFKDIRNKEN